MTCTKCNKEKECDYDTKEECEKSNKKYNMKQQPSPLNFKTHAEYKKALNIYNKANEIKLAKNVKVELSIASEIKDGAKDLPKIIKEAEKISKAFEKDATAVVKLINRINDNVKKARSQMEVGFAITDQGKTLVEEAEKKMADLGLDPNDMPGFKEFRDLRREAYFAVKGMDDAWFDFVNDIEKPEQI